MGFDPDVRAILFDLDGTLLPIDLEPFMDDYLSMLAPRFAHACDPRRFVRELIESVLAMVRDTDPNKTNMQVFCDHFFPKFGVRPQEWMPVFERFYAVDFPALRRHSRPDPVAPEVVKAAVDRGFTTVLATNPVYPRAAVVERLGWAGLSPEMFSLITTYEDMHYCKPHPEYYLEICSMTGREPRECVMVGNDVEEDLAAARAGMKTFLVKTSVRTRGDSRYSADYEGTLADLLHMILAARPRGSESPGP